MSVRSLRIPRRSMRLIERNGMVYRRTWIVIVSGFFEPLLYLLGIGYGIGSLVRNVPLGTGHAVSYVVFVAPALMATSAMNGAIYEVTFNLFHKLRYAKTFEAILVTPVGVEDVALGEVLWAWARGTIYSTGFLLVMFGLGLVPSVWGLLALPAAMLLGFSFAAIGAALTTFIRQWQDFDFVQLGLQPMLLFSATFFPITVYPPAIRWFVEITPLYRGVDLIRGLTTGDLHPGMLVDVVYLSVLALVGVALTALRLRGRLLK